MKKRRQLARICFKEQLDRRHAGVCVRERARERERESARERERYMERENKQASERVRTCLNKSESKRAS